jgi:hypothetical protein
MAKKEEDNPFEVIIGFVILFGLGYLIFSKVLPAIGGSLFTSSDDKEYCGRSSGVQNARTDAAAKLAYKSCLKRMK